MLSNYLKSAWRNLLRSKGFSLINISGLAIGMAGAIFILLWITHEISFDRFHRHSDRLYEMYGLTTVDQRLSVITLTEQALAPALKRFSGSRGSREDSKHWQFPAYCRE